MKKRSKVFAGELFLSQVLCQNAKKSGNTRIFLTFLRSGKLASAIFFRINLSKMKRNQGTSMVSRSLRAMLSLDAKGWFLASLPEGRMRFTKTGDLLASPPAKRNMLLAVIPAFSLLKCFFHSPFLYGRRLNAQAAGRPVFFRALHTRGRARI
ncbi:MAG: hypothetical protein MR400_04595 [Clostridiales bacterium]|nr:hypothetical protein [Clostridiales bacterium]